MTKSDLFNAVSALAIVIGLVLVLLELRQSRDVAEAQLAAEFASTILSFDLASMGEDAAAVQAKACHQPTELTPADRETLIAFNRAFMGRIFGTLQFRRLGLFDVADWEYFVRTREPLI